jgi:hypothetical protein
MGIFAWFRRMSEQRQAVAEPVAVPAPLPPFDQMEPPQKMGQLERWGEEAYDRMYDSRRPSGDYSEAKENFYMAIQLARELGREDEVQRLEARLAHIKGVFRSQFT